MTDYFDRHLTAAPALVILRGLGAEQTVQLARRAWELGVGLVEVPVQTDHDLGALAATVADAAGADRAGRVGAGTITSSQLVDRVAEAGAAFTVAPGCDPQVARASRQRGLPHLPGVATATEVQTALSLGLAWQKVFPASVLTPAWITAMGGPFPQVRFVATGGVDAANGRAFLDAGAAAVSLGSAFAGAGDDAVRALLQ